MGRQAKYRQVADSVLAGLRREGAGPGYKLPNVRDLARTHGTSVFTVTKALEPGEKVQFEVLQTPYGRQATQVRRVVA